jgi:peptidylprolyl isomerase
MQSSKIFRVRSARRLGSALALLVVCGHGLSVVRAQDTQPASAQPAATSPATTPATPVEPPKPAGIPVPAGEPVSTKTLANGLIIEDLKMGDGYEVPIGGSVVALYHGTRKSDGKVFDSAFDRGEPIAFPLAGVIQGWQEGVPGMKVGGVRRLTIPAALAYAERGAGADIPPNTDLVFVIQIVDALQVVDTKVGEGEAASNACIAIAAYTIKDDKGNIIEQATKEKPYIWLPGEYQAMTVGVEGMKVGGTRTIKVPKEMNLTAPAIETTRPSNVPVTIDVELLMLRNLPQGPRRR